MPLPPLSEVVDALLKVVLPTLGASLAVMLATRLWLDSRFAAVGAAVALAAGVLAGNYCRDVSPWRIDSDRPLTVRDLFTAAAGGLEKPKEPEAAESPVAAAPQAAPPLPIPPARYWLLWLAGLAMVVEAAVGLPRVPVATAWVARTLFVLLAARLLTPAALRTEHPWLPWTLGVVMLLEWATFTSLARRWPGGAAAVAAVIPLFGAAVVLLHAHSARLTDMALLAAFGCAALAAAALPWSGSPAARPPADLRVAAAAVALFLPGLLVSGYYDTFSEVPVWSFVLAAIAPLGAAATFLPQVAATEGVRRWLLALVTTGAGAGVAMLLAARAETLQF